MNIIEGITCSITVICLTFLGICWIYEKDFRKEDKDALEKRSTKKMGK